MTTTYAHCLVQHHDHDHDHRHLVTTPITAHYNPSRRVKRRSLVYALRNQVLVAYQTVAVWGGRGNMVDARQRAVALSGDGEA
jgi:hypothetical protein